MSDARAAIVARLRRMLETLAENLGNDAHRIGEDESIPDAEVLDSAGLIEFVMQIDDAYELGLQAEDMTIDNFGSIAATAAFILARRGPEAKEARPGDAAGT